MAVDVRTPVTCQKVLDKTAQTQVRSEYSLFGILTCIYSDNFLTIKVVFYMSYAVRTEREK